MPDMPSITIVKQFLYHGITEKWSNSYHFSGGTPADDAGWKTLADAWWAKERLGLAGDITLTDVYGYEAGNTVNVFHHDYLIEHAGVTVVGALSNATVPGEMAVRVRFSTTEKNSRGRPVYGQKWYHGVLLPDSGARDGVKTNQIDGFNTGCAAMYAGTLPGGVKYAMPQGQAITGHLVMPFSDPRELRRRGKRPS